jgi:hypothetical protein
VRRHTIDHQDQQGEQDLFAQIRQFERIRESCSIGFTNFPKGVQKGESTAPRTFGYRRSDNLSNPASRLDLGLGARRNLLALTVRAHSTAPVAQNLDGRASLFHQPTAHNNSGSTTVPASKQFNAST